MNTAKKKSLQASIILVIGSLIVTQICFWFLPNVFESWNLRVVDQLFVLRSNTEKFRPYYDDTIVHVDLNNTSIQQLKDFYLNRSHHAQLIQNLSAMNVGVQLYDFIFAAPSDYVQDGALINAASEAGNVYFGLAFELENGKQARQRAPATEGVRKYLEKTMWKVTVEGDPSDFYSGGNALLSFSSLASASKGLGFLNITSDPDGVFRRAPLLIRYRHGFYPSFPFRAICDYLDVSPENIIIRPGKSITLKNAKLPGTTEAHNIVIPIDRYGNMRINFIGPWERMKHYNFSDVLRASYDQDELELWKEELSGKIVMISEVTTGSSDVGPVPTDTRYPLSGLYANVIHSILTGSFVRELSNWGMFCTELIILFFILILSFRFSSIPFAIGSIIIGAGYVGVVSIFFLYGQLISHIIRPLLMATLAIVSILTYRYISEEKARGILKKSFEAYFPPPIVKKLMANPKMISERGEKKELTIMFSDIINFTRHASHMAPDNVQKLLNEYFEEMTEIVFRYGGTIDKFIGDGLMVFFGDPEPQPDHSVRCAKAAIDMQNKVKELKQRWEKRGDFPLQIRIGINTGLVFVGNIGSSRRLSYTVLGDDVNLAQRLESNAPADGIMISERTNYLIKKYINTDGPKEIQLKGYDDPVTVYEIVTKNLRKA